MPLRVRIDVVSAEEQIYSGEVEHAVFPGESGELGVLPRHAPLLTRIRPGTVRLKIPGRADYELIYVSGGMLEVQPELITLMADTAIRAQGLDEAKAIEARQCAAEANDRATNMSFATAEAELAHAISRLKPLKKKN